MSITGIKKRIACFLDDKGEFIGKKSFSNTQETFDYGNKSYNVFHKLQSYVIIKRWYWDLEIYFYNINNPNPLILNKKLEPVLSSEMYNIQLKTKVARDLNNLAGGFKLDFKTIMIGLAILIVVYLIATGKINLGSAPAPTK